MVQLEKEIDFKAIFESAPGLFLVLLPDFTILALSDAYASATITKREEIIGRHFFDVFPDNPATPDAEGVSHAATSMSFILKNKTAHTMPVQRHDIRRPDGSFEERYWSPVNKPVLNAKNEVIYIIHRVEDVTEFVRLQQDQEAKDKITDDLRVQSFAMEVEIIKRSKEIQKLIDETERKVVERTIELENVNKDISDYKFALDASNIVAVTDEKGIIQYANENFCRISKYSKEELIGQNHNIVNSGYHSKAFFRNLWETIASGKIWKGELKNRAKDGTTYWVDTTIVPFLDEQGKPYKYLSIRSDITQRKLNIEKLKASEEKYRDIFSNSLVSIFSADMNTLKTIEVNDRAVQLFGYKSREDFLNNFDSSMHFVNSDELQNNVDALMEKGELNNRIQEMKRLDGTVFWANKFIKLTADKTIAQTIILDITQQVHFQAELEAKVIERTLELTESLSREKELNEMKSHFVTMASHEFRTPLSTILSSSSLIEMYSGADQQGKRLTHINRISSSVKNLTDILNDFLTLEKLGKGFVETESSVFNLPEFLGTVVEEIDEIVEKKFQHIVYQHHGKPIVKQSKKILKNVLLNLLSNACKYSPEEKEIELTSSVMHNRVTITVKDYGLGIPEEDQNKLFTEFFRARNVKNIQGTGLGLSIVRKYLELLNGHISFVSKVNEGTIFTIEFQQNKSIS